MAVRMPVGLAAKERPVAAPAAPTTSTAKVMVANRRLRRPVTVGNRVPGVPPSQRPPPPVPMIARRSGTARIPPQQPWGPLFQKVEADARAINQGRWPCGRANGDRSRGARDPSPIAKSADPLPARSPADVWAEAPRRGVARIGGRRSLGNLFTGRTDDQRDRRERRNDPVPAAESARTAPKSVALSSASFRSS